MMSCKQKSLLRHYSIKVQQATWYAKSFPTFSDVIAHPFLDSRVLALGLSIQKQIIPEPGKMKPVLAEAMLDLLPHKITNRKRKGHFNEVYYLGLAKNAKALESMVENWVDKLAIFHKNVLIQAIHEANLGVANARQLRSFDLSLSLINQLLKSPLKPRKPSNRLLTRLEINHRCQFDKKPHKQCQSHQAVESLIPTNRRGLNKMLSAVPT